MPHFAFVWLAAIAAVSLRGLKQMRLPPPAGLPIVAVPTDRQPQPSRLEGVYQPNTLLRDHAVRLFEGLVKGSESVVVGKDGNLWMLSREGYVFTALPAPKQTGGYHLQPEPVAYVGPGRPLGFHFDSSGRLVICDSLKGLTRFDPGSGSLEVLANRISADSPLQPNSLIIYTNDLDIAKDGTVYFTDCSDVPVALNKHPHEGGWYDTMAAYLLTMWRGVPSARLLKYDPSTRSTHVLAEGLWYANGVALSADESWVGVVETCSMRVQRVWLKGPKAGTKEVLVDRLPGWPDGINRASDGGFWVALIMPDLPIARFVLKRRALRWLVTRLPRWALPPLPQWGAVVKLSPSGQVERILMDPKDRGNRISSVLAVTEHDGKLFLGNLGGEYVSVVDLAAIN